MPAAVDKKARRTARVPVTTMEELPIPSEDERDEILASLKAAEARIAAGQCAEHDPDAFVDRLMKVRAAAVRRKET